MSELPKVKFYLVHMETGQRYPVSNDEVVIGRTSGDLLFPDDSRLSNQHCRIIMTGAGLGVHDMGSANGTIVDGKSLSAEKVYTFKAGNVLQVGAQAFKLQEAGHARKLKAKKNKQAAENAGADWASRAVMFGLGVAAVYYGSQFVWMTLKRSNPPVRAAAVESPAEIVEKEVRFAFDRYKQIGQDHASGALNEKLMAQQIRKELLPLLQSVHVKLSVVRGQTEFEKRKIENTRSIVAALIGQTTAMADFAETKNPKASQRIKHFGDQLDALNEQAQAYKRKPAQY